MHRTLDHRIAQMHIRYVTRLPIGVRNHGRIVGSEPFVNSRIDAGSLGKAGILGRVGSVQ